MNLNQGIDAGQVKQMAHKRLGGGAAQFGIFGPRPGMQQDLFAEACSIHAGDAREIDDNSASPGQKIADRARECGRLVPVDDASVAVNDVNISPAACFQIQLQLWLLGQKLQSVKGWRRRWGSSGGLHELHGMR